MTIAHITQVAQDVTIVASKSPAATKAQVREVRREVSARMITVRVGKEPRFSEILPKYEPSLLIFISFLLFLELFDVMKRLPTISHYNIISYNGGFVNSIFEFLYYN